MGGTVLKKIGRWTLVLIAVSMLSGCGTVGGSAPTPLPTVVLGGEAAPASTASEDSSPSEGEGVTASGVVVPAQEARLVFAAGGKVDSVAVSLGEAVEAGQALIILDSSDAQLAVRLAEAEVAAAQAGYDLAAASAPARRAASLAAATLALTQAQNALTALQENAPLETARAQAALAQARQALADAQRERTNMDYPRANQITIDGAEANFELMEDELERAQSAYDDVKDLPANDPRRASALLDLSNAQRARDKALITLNWYLGKNSEQDLAEADAQLALAQAQVASAERVWAEVKDGPAAADLALAEANLASAQAQLELAQSPSMDVELARAQLDTAQVHLQSAQAQLARLTLSAPFSGVVAAVEISAGEWAVPGQVVLVLADTSAFGVETTDLSERDATRVAAGQSVTVFIKALDEEVGGRVTAVSPLADRLGGDVVYQTIIELDENLPGLLAGMSVEVLYR